MPRCRCSAALRCDRIAPDRIGSGFALSLLSLLSLLCRSSQSLHAATPTQRRTTLPLTLTHTHTHTHASDRPSSSASFAMSVPDGDADTVTFLAGDIGGTNSRLQLWQVRPVDDDGEPEEVKLAEHVYPSQKFASLTFVIDKFLKEVREELSSSHSYHPIACCLAVAGPVRANKAVITNVNWTLDGAEMAKQLDIPSVLIINDFVGIGYGLLALTRDDIVPVNGHRHITSTHTTTHQLTLALGMLISSHPTSPCYIWSSLCDCSDVPLAHEAPKACLGAGTGLGEVYLTAGHMLGGDEGNESCSSSAEYNVCQYSNISGCALSLHTYWFHMDSLLNTLCGSSLSLCLPSFLPVQGAARAVTLILLPAISSSSACWST